MVVTCAQMPRTAKEVTENHSLQLSRNLLRIAIFHISYIRGLFPEEYFRDTFLQGLEMQVKKLLPLDLESRRLIDWMEKGVYDALKKKYLKTMLFSLSEGEDGPKIEEYSFSFNYSTTSEEVSMQLAKDGRHRETLSAGVSLDQIRKSTCKMMRTLVTIMRTLDSVPSERTILMKLHYYDDVTPIDYEPPFFRCCTYDEKKAWRQNAFQIKAGEVNSNHIILSLKVKSTLDPCQDEIDMMARDALSSGDAETSNNSEDSNNSEQAGLENEADNCASKPFTPKETNNLVEDDEITQDVREETRNLEDIKEWLLSRGKLGNVHIGDVMSSFPNISEALIEELLHRLVEEGTLSDLGKDNFKINKASSQEPELQERTPAGIVSEEFEKENSLYLKALCYVLPLEHVSVPQLQSKLGSRVSHATTRKLVEKMVNDGYVEGTPAANKRLGRKVIHSEQSKRKLEEVYEALNHIHLSQRPPSEPPSYNPAKKDKQGEVLSHHRELTKAINEMRIQPQTPTGVPNKDMGERLDIPAEDLDGSTCGGLHSFGSDLTRNENPRRMNQDSASPARIMNKRATSRESHLNANSEVVTPSKAQKPRTKRGVEFQESQETYEKDPFRKASMVEEPIYQSAEKRARM